MKPLAIKYMKSIKKTNKWYEIKSFFFKFTDSNHISKLNWPHYQYNENSCLSVKNEYKQKTIKKTNK